jgi:hypothetical protein
MPAGLGAEVLRVLGDSLAVEFSWHTSGWSKVEEFRDGALGSGMWVWDGRG